MKFKHLTLLNNSDESVVQDWLDSNNVEIIDTMIYGLDVYIFYKEIQ